jgi:hypothetical protein
MRSGVNTSRDFKFPARLSAVYQLLFHRFALVRRQLSIEIIEQLVWIHPATPSVGSNLRANSSPWRHQEVRPCDTRLPLLVNGG